MTAEQVLQEAIIALQRQELGDETTRLVEEAAQLLANGRDMEARALVEKAQALTCGLPAKQNGASKPNSPVAFGHMDPTIISRISARLTQSITSALSEAIVDLHRNFGEQMKAIVGSMEDRLTETASQLRDLPSLQQRVERVEQAEAVRASTTREQWDRLSASVTALEGTARARQAEAEQFNRHISNELEAITSRMTEQEKHIATLDRLVEDLSPRVRSTMDQIEQHTALLQSMSERQAHRVATLNEVLDTIAKLREPEPMASKAVAG